MTMKALVVNMSNWDDEDIIVRETGAHGAGETRLKPGEATPIALEHVTGGLTGVEIESQPGEPQPFYLRGADEQRCEQVFPQAVLTVGRNTKVHSG